MSVRLDDKSNGHIVPPFDLYLATFRSHCPSGVRGRNFLPLLYEMTKVYTIALNLTLNSDELAKVNQQPTSTPSIGCQLYDDSVVFEPQLELMYGFTLVTPSVRSKS